jgi:hypothetical protein
MIKSLAFLFLVAPALLQADALYLYTIDFDATQVTAATSVSYLSVGTLPGNSQQFLPVQSTVITLPSVFATQTPGTGAGSVSSSEFGLDFILNGNNLLFLGDTSTNIMGPGTYDFSYSNLSYIDGQNYTPGGQVVVTQVAAPSLYFRYTESWNATAYSAATSYYYDSPVFLVNGDNIGYDPTGVLSLPGPGAAPNLVANDFTFSQQAAGGYFTDNSGNAWFFSGATASPITTTGTFNIVNGSLYYDGTTVNDTGTVRVSYAAASTPEPGSLWLFLAGVLWLSAYTFRRSHRSHFR